MQGITDITTVNAVQSLWRDGPKDPWAVEAADRLAEWLIWTDAVKVFLPINSDGHRGEMPSLVNAINDVGQVLQPCDAPIQDGLKMPDKIVEDFFDLFVAWTLATHGDFKVWSHLHAAPWLRVLHESRINTQDALAFNFDRLKNSKVMQVGIAKTGFDSDVLSYGFDVAIRYFLSYGPRVPTDHCYFSHAIRETVKWPSEVGVEVVAENAQKYIAPISLSAFVQDKVKSNQWGQHEYIDFIHRGREAARATGLIAIRKNGITNDMLNQFGKALNLPPQLAFWNKRDRTIATAGVALAGMGFFPTMVGVATFFGAGTAILELAATKWGGELPVWFSSKWLAPLRNWHHLKNNEEPNR